MSWNVHHLLQRFFGKLLANLKVKAAQIGHLYLSKPLISQCRTTFSAKAKNHTGAIKQMDSLAQKSPNSEFVATQKDTHEMADLNSSPAQEFVVVGAGPTGIGFCHEVLRKAPLAKITLFGNEQQAPYNRAKLTRLLANTTTVDDIALLLPSPEKHPNFSQINHAIVRVEPEIQTVEDAFGNCLHYDALILATGSAPKVPKIQGVNLSGVFTFRSLKDAETLYSRLSSARHIVIAGGGLLGVETAKAFAKHHAKITLVHQGEHLINRHLDALAGGLIQEKLERSGIATVINAGVRKILGTHRVTGIVTREGDRVDCDTVILCTGVIPSTQLAKHARLNYSRGILVNANLQTSDQHIYAIGDCAEYKGNTYGLVSPGLDQARRVANLLTQSNPQSTLPLKEPVYQLKITGEYVFSLGLTSNTPPHPLISETIYTDPRSGAYRKLLFRRGKIIGAIAVGYWPEKDKIQQLFHNEKRVFPWQRLLFKFTGNLFLSTRQQSPNADTPPNDNKNVSHKETSRINTNDSILDKEPEVNRASVGTVKFATKKVAGPADDQRKQNL